jgi:hypothetical protein
MLQPGYNLVTERTDETEAELGALKYLRRLAAADPLPDRVTVTGLDDLLVAVDEAEREAAIEELRRTLRERSLSPNQVVQFTFDGSLMDDDVVTLAVDNGGETVYLPLGDAFVERPRREGATRFVSSK